MIMHTLRSELVKVRVSTVWVALLATALLVPWVFSAVLFGLSEFPQELPTTQWGYRFGILPIAALGALSISSELQSGSAAFTFTATPERWRPLTAKAVVLVLTSIPVGLIAGGGSWLIAWLLQGDGGPPLELDSVDDYRMVLGVGVVYGIAAILGLAVGALLGRPVAAVVLLLVWPLLIENVAAGLPVVGERFALVLPFIAADEFISGVDSHPYWSLLYFAVFSGVLVTVAAVQLERRDL